MTIDVSGCLDDLTLPEDPYGRSTKDNSEPPSELIDFVLGNNPPTSTFNPPEEHPIARCSQVEPNEKRESTVPPALEKGPKLNDINPWEMIKSLTGPKTPTYQAWLSVPVGRVWRPEYSLIRGLYGLRKVFRHNTGRNHI